MLIKNLNMPPNEKDPINSVEEEAMPKVSEELKSMVDAGDEVMPSNPNSLGYGIQQIKLDYWNPENEKYWEVRSNTSHSQS